MPDWRCPQTSTPEFFVDLQLLFAMRLFEVLQLITEPVGRQVRLLRCGAVQHSVEGALCLVEATPGPHEI